MSCAKCQGTCVCGKGGTLSLSEILGRDVESIPTDVLRKEIEARRARARTRLSEVYKKFGTSEDRNFFYNLLWIFWKVAAVLVVFGVGNLYFQGISILPLPFALFLFGFFVVSSVLLLLFRDRKRAIMAEFIGSYPKEAAELGYGQKK